MTIRAEAIASILGGKRTLKREVRSVEELREAVEQGFPVRALHAAVRRVAADRREAAALKYQIVPRSTLRRRKSRLSVAESERLERLARMAALAEEVWEDSALAHEFLTSHQPQLGGERPVDLARSDLGTRQVERVLMRLEYALPA